MQLCNIVSQYISECRKKIGGARQANDPWTICIELDSWEYAKPVWHTTQYYRQSGACVSMCTCTVTHMCIVYKYMYMCIQVNDVSISDANHDDAAKAFKLAGSVVQLLVQYDLAQFNRFQVE